MIAGCIKHYQTDRVKDAEADGGKQTAEQGWERNTNVCRPAGREKPTWKGQDKLKVLLK